VIQKDWTLARPEWVGAPARGNQKKTPHNQSVHSPDPLYLCFFLFFFNLEGYIIMENTIERVSEKTVMLEHVLPQETIGDLVKRTHLEGTHFRVFITVEKVEAQGIIGIGIIGIIGIIGRIIGVRVTLIYF
jgi:hypothetical protein